MKLRIGFLCLAAAWAASAQVPAPSAPPPAPPVPQKMPMGYRPIRVPQLAPYAPVVTPAPAPNVQPPLAPPAEVQAPPVRATPMFAPAGINGRMGQPHRPVPGQPLQPVHVHGGQPVIQPVVQPAYQPPPPAQPASYLAWDAERRETNVPAGVVSVPFTFWLTNVSTEVVAINYIRTSCGCTVAQLPAQPWKLLPGDSGPINVTMNLAGKMGSIEKGVTVDSTAGMKTLIVRANMPMPGGQPVASGIDPERMKNMQMALADRQVVFRGECAKCHVEPAVAKMDKPLYDAACGICHDSTHRAAMVPDLAKLRHPTNEEHWRKWIKSGRPGSMMPAFAKAEGGPLTDEQIESLVKFLTESITAKAKPAPAANPATSAQLPPVSPRDTASAAPVPKTNVQ